MSTRKRPRAKQNLFRQIWRLSVISLTRIFKWLLRCHILLLKEIGGRQTHLAKSGFILPTVAMVTLVVVLLTTALVFRSFDRAGKASNIRVNQAVLNAAMPAIDRARAKMEALLSDSALPRSTPTDFALYDFLSKGDKYTFGGETRLKLVNNINGIGGIQKQPGTNYELEKDETLTTAWKFPIDSDNNGKFDSYTLYGIYFRSPTRNANGSFNRARNSLEARTPPMSGGSTSSQCANVSATSASLVGDSSWFKSGSKLKKSFFVYTATVPITNPPSDSNYEAKTGNNSFSALELQQDHSRNSLTNNAVVFQDDLEITPGPDFRLNGRIFTNANLLAGGRGASNLVRFYQVSSKQSCFYEEDNSKITVGGNLGTGNIDDTTDRRAVTVDLYRGFNVDPTTATIDGDTRSTDSAGGSQIAFNDSAYNKRIALMKQSALSLHPNYNTTTKDIDWSSLATVSDRINSVTGVARYSSEVKEGFKRKLEADGGDSLDPGKVLGDEIELYLRNRTRRVPYAEISSVSDNTAIGTYDSDGDGVDTNVFESGTIEPIAAWREPVDATYKLTNTTVSLHTDRLPQTEPEKQKQDRVETRLGDRIYVGNNLPAYWKKDSTYVTGPYERQMIGTNINWTAPNDKPRYRTTQVVPLPDLGISDRDGYWEDAAAKQTSSIEPNVGGLRVITGAGIYRNPDSTFAALSAASFLPDIYNKSTLDSGLAVNTPLPPPLLAGESTSSSYKQVWSDLMPMSGGEDNPTAPPDLRMRATAVYHYKANAGIEQTPVACVSSYFDPTNSTTAKNKIDFDGGYGKDTTNGRSNNGVVYPPPYSSNADRFTEIGTYLTELKAQAKLKFPNGRIVNEPLQKALQKLSTTGALANSSKPLSLSENSAVDTAICALKILTDSTFTPTTNPVGSISNFPHGTIKEAAFLDGREIKAVEGDDADSSNYDLDAEQRQPLEARVTELDLAQLRQRTVGGATQQEYLLPNSGIIYASRDDALRDATDSSAQSEILSPTDFRLDPTRRPNGIRLINGSNLARSNNYREEEKGLILVTNLPVYVKADSSNGFNYHRLPGTTTATEEFTDQLNSDWSDFYSRNATLNTNFACRINQAGCGSSGDQWRPATIIADAISLQSNAYRDGFRNEGDYDLNNNARSIGYDFNGDGDINDSISESSVSVSRDLNFDGDTSDTVAEQALSNPDLREKLRKNGFWDNSFATSAFWWDTGNNDNAYPDEKAADRYVGSYLTNGVTPVQRRVDFSEYVMEVCRKIPVSFCQLNDWVVGFDMNGNGSLDDTVTFDVNGDGVVNAGDTEKNIKANQLGQALTIAGKSPTGSTLNDGAVNWSTAFVSATGGSSKSPLERLGAGTTARAALVPADQRYARRVAFARNQFHQLIFTTIGTGAAARQAAKPLGVGCNLDTSGTAGATPPVNNGCQYPNSGTRTEGTHYGKAADNALWFRTTSSTTGEPGTADSYAADRPLFYQSPNNGGNKLMLPDTPKITGVTSLNGSGTNDPSDFTMCITSSGTGAGVSKEYSVSTVSDSCPININTQVGQLQGLTPTGALTGNTQTISASTTSQLNVYTLPSGNPTINNSAVITLNGNANSIFVFQGDNSVSFGSNAGGVGISLVLNGVDPNNIFWVSNGSLDINDATTGQQRLAGNFIGKTSLKIGANTQVLGGRFLNFTSNPGGIPSTSKIYAVAGTDQPTLVPVLQLHSPEGSPGATLATGGSLHDEWLQQATTDTTFNAAFIAGNSPGRPREDQAGLHNFVRFMQKWGAAVNIKGSFIQYKRSTYSTAPFAPVRDANAIRMFNGIDIKGDPLFYYSPPTRQWGFDVALLSQPPDLFAQKFTQQTETAPEEFFREVGRDDPWVKTLLCAAQKGSDDDYTYAVDDASLRGSCPFGESAYND
jgi:hypothetical protein